MATRRQPDWLLSIVGGMLGLFFGGALAWFTMLSDGPTLNPIEPVVSYARPRQPGVPATLEVYLFDDRLYSRTAPNPDDFKFETGILHFATPGLFTICAGFFGVGAGMLLKKRVRARPIRG